MLFMHYGVYYHKVTSSNEQQFKLKVNRETFESSCSADRGGQRKGYNTVITAVLEENVSVACVRVGKIVVSLM